ncbi:hypothetical protein EOPP23_06405 [Endozoicomonas sp. OPT23]|nr:hypothetical protein [Endozoicomonas sp. OPT23]
MSSDREEQESALLKASKEFPFYKELVKSGLISFKHNFIIQEPAIYYLKQGYIHYLNSNKIILDCNYETRFFYDTAKSEAFLAYSLDPSRSAETVYSSIGNAISKPCGATNKQPDCYVMPEFIPVVKVGDITLTHADSESNLSALPQQFHSNHEDYTVYYPSGANSLASICPELRNLQNQTINFIRLEWKARRLKLECQLFFHDPKSSVNQELTSEQNSLIWSQWFWELAPNPRLWHERFRQTSRSDKQRNEL